MQPNDLFNGLAAVYPNAAEAEIRVPGAEFRSTCLLVCQRLRSPVMALFAVDQRREFGNFQVRCVFLAREISRWCSVVTEVAGENPVIESLAKEIYSSALFEREMKEMFGIVPQGNPDTRPLRLHDEVWPAGSYPLRKDFQPPAGPLKTDAAYSFNRVEGEGVFEVPVGPVHAGIIGPGHFRFSVAGEPIVNLEQRLGFTHRGVEKIFEGMSPEQGLLLSECVAGDSVIGHSWAYCRAVETVLGLGITVESCRTRALCLELERIYNHFSGISGIALDVGFSFPSQFASLAKERVLRLNKELFGHRYLKGVLSVGGVQKKLGQAKAGFLEQELARIKRELQEIRTMLYGSVSFLDRVDQTGVLRKKTAEDFGVVGLAARASGIALDLRRVFPEDYLSAAFRLVKQEKGDVLARLRVRLDEIEESIRMIGIFAVPVKPEAAPKHAQPGSCAALGAVEGSRGPVLYWVKINGGQIDRCKIVDPSFHNWPGLSAAVLGDIVPDFPVCNKSFDLSYAGNDL